MPTKAQIEEYIKCADLNLGPECCEDWVEQVRKLLRGHVWNPVYSSAAGGAGGVSHVNTEPQTEKENKMTLRKEYQAIVTDYSHDFGQESREHAVAEQVAERCQALADKPPKMLTDAEMSKVVQDTRECSMTYTCRAIEAAHIAKQKEPEKRRVKVYVYEDSCGALYVSSNHQSKMFKLIDSFEREVTL